MSKPKSCKIYLKLKEGLCDFLWATMSADNSVMIGIKYNVQQKTHVIIDSEKGVLKQGEFVEDEPENNPKITFHYSGQYKVSTNVGRTKKSIDRCTVVGPRLDQIHKPRRMMDIIIPNKLKVTNKKITENDIALDATAFPRKPLRCTIWCCDIGEFHKWDKERSNIVDNSILEYTHALEDGQRVWGFTLRRNPEDEVATKEFIIHVIGEFKWGNKPQTI